MNKHLLRLPDVLMAMGHKRSTLYLRIKQGLIPRPCKLSERCTAWPSDEITALVAAHVAGKSEFEIRELVIKLELQRHTTA
ncbi:MAG: AlpA family phage regulatory protein [Sphingobacteriales bacterium]|nr:MAG: AlpA family phage regulatory protein [Sphingobacteriales bacterium]